MRIHLIYVPEKVRIIDAKELAVQITHLGNRPVSSDTNKIIFWRKKNFSVASVFQDTLVAYLGVNKARLEVSEGNYITNWINDNYYEDIFLVVDTDTEYKEIINRFGFDDKNLGFADYEEIKYSCNVINE